MARLNISGAVVVRPVSAIIAAQLSTTSDFVSQSLTLRLRLSGNGGVQAHRRSKFVRRLHIDPSSRHIESNTNSEKPETLRLDCIGTFVVGIETDAIIVDTDNHKVILLADRNVGPRRPRMASNIEW